MARPPISFPRSLIPRNPQCGSCRPCPLRNHRPRQSRMSKSGGSLASARMRAHPDDADSCATNTPARRPNTGRSSKYPNQVRSQFPGGRIAPFRLPLHALHEHRLQISWHGPAAVTRRYRLPHGDRADVCFISLRGVRQVERGRTSSADAPEDQVYCFGDRPSRPLSQQLPRRHVANRSHEVAPSASDGRHLPPASPKSVSSNRTLERSSSRFEGLMSRGKIPCWWT